VDEVAHEPLGGHLQQRLLEPQLLVELPQQVLPEVDDARVCVLGLRNAVRARRTLRGEASLPHTGSRVIPYLASK
jgi:hypothetical protein